MRDPLFAWAFILLSVLGILQAVIEWLFWRRLASAEPAAVRRLLGTDVATAAHSERSRYGGSCSGDSTNKSRIDRQSFSVI